MGTVSLVILLIQTGLIILQDYSSNKAMESFIGLATKHARVLRDGRKMKILSTDLVVGDVVLLAEGVKVPADLRIFECKQLAVNNSMITGEREAVRIMSEKYDSGSQVKYIDATNMVFMSSMVANGSGKGIVVATGRDTYISSIIHRTDNKNIVQKETRLQKEINKFSKLIFVVSIST